MNLEGPLREFLTRNNFSFKEGGKSFITDCPSCKKSAHTYIRKTNGQSICFKCSSKWNWKKLVALVERCTESEAWSSLFGKGSGNELETEEWDPFETEEYEAPDPTPVYLGPDFTLIENSNEALEYLEKRGVTSFQSIVDFELKYNEMMNAVVFPIKKEGKTFGWQARKIAPKPGEPRMLTMRNFNKAKFFLNYDNLTNNNEMVIVEGPFDCIKVAQAGFGCVASLGKHISLDQLKMVLDSPIENIYIGLDPDAYEEVYSLINSLCSYKKVYRVTPGDKKDFGECSVEEVVTQMKKAHKVDNHLDYLEVYLKD